MKNSEITNICAVCGGVEIITSVTRQFSRHGQVFVFQNIPVTVCESCGTVFFSEENLQKIDRLIESGHTVPAPVNSFLISA
jgi:YgiT-type zinc finger domain-containing protein